jgi:peptidoglycan/LPS O-acetylase OafA/YrhL
MVVTQRSERSYVWGVAAAAASCLSSATSTFAIFAVILRFVSGTNTIWRKLGECSFGIYIAHYPLVAWLQYWLLPTTIPAVKKLPWFQAKRSS